MNRDQKFVMNKLQAAWNAITSDMKAMYQSVSYEPQDLYKIFRAVDQAGSDVKFDIGPLVLNMPERAGRSGNLFVVVKGWLVFEGGNLRTLPLRTKTFGTEVGYFRRTDTGLEHVFGAHYDLDETLPAHPVIHAQFKSMADLDAQAKELFRLDGDTIDRFEKTIRNIRLPCAQMDVFATVLQICADHLVYDGADSTVHDAFARMRETNDFMVGVAHRLDFLSAEKASHCYRSQHWYERS